MLKIAIIGTGAIVKSHLAAVNQLDDVELVAVCDINEEKAKFYSQECGVPYVLDYKELPSKVDFDAVILNLPHGLHCEVSEFFLDAGKHVLVEKPMANTVEECERMIAAAERSGKKLGIAHVQRYITAVQKAKEIHESGELGKLCMCTEYRSGEYFGPNRPGWFFNKKMAGGGIGMNYLAHAFDRVFSVIGEQKIESLDAQCGNLATDHEVEGHIQVFAKFENGVSTAISLNGYTSTGYECYFHYTGGSIKITGKKIEVNRADGNGFVPVELSKDLHTFAQELDAFHRYIKGEPTDIPDGKYSMAIIDAIQVAYEKGGY